MIFTEPMRQLVAVVLDHDAEKVSRELLRHGVLHFVNVTEVDHEVGSRVAAVTPKVSEALIAEIRRRIESFLGIINERPQSHVELKVEDLKALDLEATNRELDAFAADLQALRDKQGAVQQEILKLEDIQRQIELFGDLGSAIRNRSQYSYLQVQTGVVRSAVVESFGEALSGLPSVHIELGREADQTTFLLITMKRDEPAVNKILDRFGWMEVHLPKEAQGSREKVGRELGERLAALRAEQDSLRGAIEALVQKKKAELEQMWANIRLNELYVRMQSYFSHTSRTVIFSGWLPAERQGSLEEAIRRAAEGRCYLEWHTPRELPASETRSVPVQIKNPRFLSPFQMLVQNYSMPEYGAVDPTPFVAVAYLVMFGLMFGDVGHGAVLLLLGLLGALTYRGPSDNVRNLLKLVAWCGGAAMVTGVLFGSYFGMQWFPPLWFDYHGIISGHPQSGYVKNIYSILLITIYFGIAVIGLGLALNWVNLISKRRWFQLVFDKGGLLGSWIYAAGVYVAFYFVRHDYKQLPDGTLLMLLVGLPVLLLMAKPPLEYLRHRPRKPFGLLTPVDFFMEWLVEILEIFSGYLANTLSFMRVAGLGIAHVSLMIAFFSIAGMLAGPGGGFSIGSILVLVAGNLLVIALEGLSAGIQSLRLNYYEFFSKYFSGTGRAYQPVSLRSRS
ncbi:MAG: ATPase V [Spirochaetales bacterium]|nr:ATPase V [Spirochaetales bacterium]